MNNKTKKQLKRAITVRENGRLITRPESLVAESLKALKPSHKALAMVENLLLENRHSDMLRQRYYQLLDDLKLHAKLIDATETVLSKRPRDKLALSYQSLALRSQGNTPKAIKLLETLLKTEPNNAITLNALGTALKDQGVFERADQLFDRALTITPRYTKALWNRSDITSDVTRDLQRINKQLNNPQVPVSERHYLHFAAYRLLDALEEREAAFEHLNKGNKSKRALVDFDVHQEVNLESTICEVFSSAFLQARADLGNLSKRPIFIFGLPRSGTTLVEQVLASHSAVLGGGELTHLANAAGTIKRRYQLDGTFSDWMQHLNNAGWAEIGGLYAKATQAMSDGTPRITDKALLNYRAAGFIKLCLPNAKLIQVERNPMDLCFGCYRQLFVSDSLAFTYSFDELAKVYASYQKTMHHWDTVMPKFILRINYEDLVTDFESTVKRLLDFCELDFEETCTQPHQTDRVIETLSASQVRQPIFNSGLQRWRRYEKQLEALQTALLEVGADLEQPTRSH